MQVVYLLIQFLTQKRRQVDLTKRSLWACHAIFRGEERLRSSRNLSCPRKIAWRSQKVSALDASLRLVRFPVPVKGRLVHKSAHYFVQRSECGIFVKMTNISWSGELCRSKFIHEVKCHVINTVNQDGSHFTCHQSPAPKLSSISASSFHTWRIFKAFGKGVGPACTIASECIAVRVCRDFISDALNIETRCEETRSRLGQ